MNEIMNYIIIFTTDAILKSKALPTSNPASVIQVVLDNLHRQERITELNSKLTNTNGSKPHHRKYYNHKQIYFNILPVRVI